MQTFANKQAKTRTPAPPSGNLKDTIHSMRFEKGSGLCRKVGVSMDRTVILQQVSIRK
jgi:hypothetical protein